MSKKKSKQKPTGAPAAPPKQPAVSQLPSLKPSKASSAPPSVPHTLPPPTAPAANVKQVVRREMREAYERGTLKPANKAALLARFLAQYPGNAESVRQIVSDYGAVLEKKAAEAKQSDQPVVSIPLNGQNEEPVKKKKKKDKNEPVQKVDPANKQIIEQREQEPVQANDKKGKKNKNKNKEKSPDDSHSPLPASPGVYAPPAQTNGDHQVEEPEGVQLPVEQLELKSEVEPGNAILNDFKQDLGVRASRPPETRTTSAFPSLEEQVHLLSLKEGEHQRPSGRASDAVLFSPGLETVGYETPAQYALLGHLPGADGAAAGADPRVMLNTNVPFSAFICGLQGSGKSHTTSCIIENCSFGLEALGRLQKPLSTLVLQFNEYSSHGSSQPSEAAFLASVLAEYSADVRSIPVTVLVSPSNYHPLRQMYSQIPNVQVRPFRLQPRHLNISTMLALMSLGRKDAMPLYMAQVTKLLRQMAMESTSGAFDYLAFRRRLTGLHLDRSQTPFLDQRLDLLDSFLDLEPRTAASPPGDYFVDGGITILDLSCPFMDESTACILFRIAIDLFLHAHPSRGKMIVADEAHKYMTDTPAGHALTETFMTVMRQQRHLGVRLIVSTQEPTISPRLIDLCSITIVHRFSSPEWYQTIQKHIAVESDDDPSPSSPSDGLARISRLRTGEALVFAPSAVLREGDTDIKDVRQRTFKMMVRKRITWDGGQTIVCIR